MSQTENGAKTIYHLDLNAGLTQVLDDGSRTYLYGNGRVGYTANDAPFYYLGDALGSVREVVQGDTEPQVMLMRDYEPYGEVLAEQGGDASGYGYTGEMFDTQTGLVFLRARYYSPADGRFLSKDAWQGDYNLPMSYNSWLYVYSDPINSSDPGGKMPQYNSEFEACVSSVKLSGVAKGIKENVCGMIAELEGKGFLSQKTDADHIPDDGGLRSPKTAHRFSTAYHILHDFVSIEDLRKTPIDADGNIWYKQEWDIYYCLFNNVFLDPQKRITWLGYLDFLIKRNASDQVENHINGRFSGYIYTLFGRIPDVSYALEGYTVGDPNRLPNSSNPGISKHIYGLAVDVSQGVMHEDVWKDLGQTEIDRIAHNHRLKRPLNVSDYVAYTTDEVAEWWHFEPLGK